MPNGRNHFRWYMNLDGKDTTTIDMVTEGRKSNAVISFNDDEEDEPPLHIGDVIGLTELQQFFPNLLKNENQNGIISNVAKCGKKSSLDAILHRQLSRDRGTSNCSFLKVADLTIDEAYAHKYLKTVSDVHHFKTTSWKDVKVSIYI